MDKISEDILKVMLGSALGGWLMLNVSSLGQPSGIIRSTERTFTSYTGDYKITLHEKQSENNLDDPNRFLELTAIDPKVRPYHISAEYGKDNEIVFFTVRASQSTEISEACGSMNLGRCTEDDLIGLDKLLKAAQESLPRVLFNGTVNGK